MQIDEVRNLVTQHDELQARIIGLRKCLEELEEVALVAGSIEYLSFRPKERYDTLVQIYRAEIGVQDFLLFLEEKLNLKIKTLEEKQKNLLEGFPNERTAYSNTAM